MKIYVLMENTSAAEGFQAEHGLSLYAETARHRILADTGQSGHFLENAEKMGVDLTAVDTVVISHGHYDHAGGLLSFAAVNPQAEIYMQRSAAGSFYHGERYIGIDHEILKLPRLHLLDGDLKIDEELSVFTGITGRRLWPSGNRLLTEKVRSSDVPGSASEVKCSCVPDATGPGRCVDIQDSFTHEQCLVIKDAGKRVLLSGCAHNGILNILDRFREIYGTEPDAVISGFHMMKAGEYTPEEIHEIEETAKELAGYRTMFYTGHCTGQPAFERMLTLMPANLRAIRAGDVIHI